jgi:hypothetical protein
MERHIAEEFVTKEVHRVLREQLELLDKMWETNKLQLKEELIEEVSKIYKVIIEKQSNEELYDIAFLSFLLLRTKIQSKEFSYQVVVYNDKWYLEDGIVVGNIKVEKIFQFYINTLEILTKQMHQYGSSLKVSHIEIIMQIAIKEFHEYVVKLLRYSILEAIALESYSKIQKADKLCIYAGEIFGEADYIFKDNRNKIDIFELREKMDEKKALIFEDLREMKLENMDFSSMNLEYTDFRNSHLKNSDFSDATLRRTRFEGANLLNSKFMFAVIDGATFENADLRGSNFANAVIKNVDFEHADINECIFDGAKFENCKSNKVDDNKTI